MRKLGSLETLTGNHYFFHLVCQLLGLPHPDSTFLKGWRSLVGEAPYPLCDSRKGGGG